jgi:hypothetical protein
MAIQVLDMMLKILSTALDRQKAYAAVLFPIPPENVMAIW